MLNAIYDDELCHLCRSFKVTHYFATRHSILYIPFELEICYVDGKYEIICTCDTEFTVFHLKCLNPKYKRSLLMNEIYIHNKEQKSQCRKILKHFHLAFCFDILTVHLVIEPSIYDQTLSIKCISSMIYGINECHRTIDYTFRKENGLKLEFFGYSRTWAYWSHFYYKQLSHG